MKNFALFVVMAILVGASMMGTGRATNGTTPGTVTPDAVTKAFLLSLSSPDSTDAGTPLGKPAAVPEPQTYLEIVFGGLVLLYFIQRRKSKLSDQSVQA